MKKPFIIYTIVLLFVLLVVPICGKIFDPQGLFIVPYVIIAFIMFFVWLVYALMFDPFN